MNDRPWFVYVEHNARRLKLLHDHGHVGLREADQRELERILTDAREEDALFIDRFYDVMYATIQRLQLKDSAMEIVTGGVEWHIEGMPIQTTDDDGNEIEAQVALANDLATDVAEAIENAVKAWLKQRKEKGEP